MKAQSITKESHTEIDLHQILALPHEEFLPQVFCILLGRDPDPFGLLHYALRLNKKISRTQIVVEMRSSDEGIARARAAPCQELDALTRRYLLLKKLPLGRWRWHFLRRLEPRSVADNTFHWEQRATAYVQSAIITTVPKELDQRLNELQAEMERLRTDLHESGESLAPQVSPSAATPPLEQTLNPAARPFIPAHELPWTARSIYHQLLWQLSA
ncbi:DUF4214 domain-containing protein [Acidithiobacillus ferrooxidans]|uniref:DUF4214 domain-containing protein n=1 Tax=Acidithiobacillus ferrooxidans (strain ATCC 23270 / DSM 14882 / CIP 104768 / NCIMB 8455) TaxID=243159 RepID=B7J9T8_ACIF2|nr:MULTISPECIES: DUF4214 domain-containing protein [Acidithiobacillus]ACK78032.1 hypothetical protein AFE_2965 [Acidithiobacillus ferrooxidans ATCC 23270]MBN6745002.1 DUF4214 domain-containing protein [Acidithiobacillus sp. MC2.2]MBN6748000.1 DUF4214 domain-containing protein [Acidithiobacillus sp. PG05]